MSLIGVVAVIDFETTGLSPAMGDRATEVAIVLLEGGRIVDRLQWVFRFIVTADSGIVTRDSGHRDRG